jgi:hypothetical protein
LGSPKNNMYYSLLFWATHLSMKQGSLFCFVRVTSPKSQCFMSRSWYLQKALDEHGCTDLVWDCLELWCESYWLLNHFLNET